MYETDCNYEHVVVLVAYVACICFILYVCSYVVCDKCEGFMCM